MGKKQGFKDFQQGQCHVVGAKYMEDLAFNVHENVPEYDEVRAALQSD